MKFKRFISRLFGIWVKVDPSIIIDKMRVYSTYYSDFGSHYITDIEFYVKGSNHKLVITTHRPGILVGVKGRTIDGLKAYLSASFKPLEISIKESNLWYPIKKG